ncbi:hypothetical protein CQ011_02355 [Arthrobacter sp. MYb213]|nr:hypothetical protein CQ011_02355 [Arthrobacter sp. MYb213]
MAKFDPVRSLNIWMTILVNFGFMVVNMQWIIMESSPIVDLCCVGYRDQGHSVSGRSAREYAYDSKHYSRE